MVTNQSLSRRGGDSERSTQEFIGDDEEPDSPFDPRDAEASDQHSVRVDLVDERQTAARPNHDDITRAVHAAAGDQGFTRGVVGVLITDDQAIHRINRDHLSHDYPTDVISFGYDADTESKTIEGELVVSDEFARRESAERGIDAADELLLYIIHGTLHIAGLDDTDDCTRAEMRAAERRVLMACGRGEDETDRIVGASS